MYKQQYISTMNEIGHREPGENGLFNRAAVLRTERGISRQERADAVGVNCQICADGDCGGCYAAAGDLLWTEPDVEKPS